MQDLDFLHKIASDPEPDLPRLIYADWLEERGDPRAEFIRLQCARAPLHPSDPRHQELLRRERLLVRRCRNEWVRPLYLDLELPSGKFLFHRGVIEEAQFTAEVLLKHGPALFATLPTLRRLEILKVDLADLESLRHLDCLQGIRGLRVVSPRWDLPATWLEALYRLPCMPRLTWLDLQDFGFSTTAGVLDSDTNRLPELEVLSLRTNWQQGFRPLSSGGLLARLRVLKLGHTWSRQEWWELLLNQPTRLEQLACDCTPAELELLVQSPGLQHLHTLETDRHERHWQNVDGEMQRVDRDRYAPDLIARLQARFGPDCLREVYVPWV